MKAKEDVPKPEGQKVSMAAGRGPRYPGMVRLDKTKDEDRCREAYELVHWKSDGQTTVPTSSWDPFVEQTCGGHRAYLPRHKCLLPDLARQDVPTLITGARGTGKEELARQLQSHEQNPRRGKAFEVVDCEALEGSDLAVDLFGRGGQRRGRLVDCNGGTVLIEHVDLLPEHCKSRLIRFLRRGEVQPVDSDRAVRNVDVRLLATARTDGDGVPVAEDLLGWFMRKENLPPLDDMKGDIPFLLAEFFRPFDVIRDVHVNWLFHLLCQDWPGNIDELSQYCERAKAEARGRNCPTLNGALGPVRLAKAEDCGIGPTEVVNSLLALSEKEFRAKEGWPRRLDVFHGTANSLRLLVQLTEDGEYDLSEQPHVEHRGIWLPYYFHPYRIPLELFFEGSDSCPACYDHSVTHSSTDCALWRLDMFLSSLAAVASNPAKLAKNEDFRAAFGTDPAVMATLAPSNSFVYWVGSLKASVPKYEELRKGITVPTQKKGRGKDRNSRPKERFDKTTEKETGAFLKFQVDSDTFSWQDVQIFFLQSDDLVVFTYNGTRSEEYYIKELPNIGSRKSKDALTQQGVLLHFILKSGFRSFTLETVKKQCKWERSPVKDADASARETVRLLNRTLWNLFLSSPQPKEGHNAIIYEKTTQSYKCRFTLNSKAEASDESTEKRPWAPTGCESSSQDEEEDEEEDQHGIQRQP